MRAERHDPPRSADDDKSPHERFTELGKRLMAVPKPELDAQEAKWQRERQRQKDGR